MKADLHMHTIHSDGELSVKQLIQRALDKKLDYIAITDHDTLKGVYEAMICDTDHLKIIPGIELSTSYHGESVHVLGYFNEMPAYDGPLEAFINNQKRIRDERAEKMVHLVKEHFDLDIDLTEIFNENSGVITRGHIAKEIMKKYPNFTTDELFKTVLANNSKTYVPSTKISTVDGIKLLKECGALAIIAHPGIYRKLTFDQLFELGADGIEVDYKSHSPEFRKELLKEVKARKMVFTAGSDYHGEITKNHGDIGDESLKEKDLNQFLKRVSQLNPIKDNS